MDTTTNIQQLTYTYKVLKDVIFVDFVAASLSAKFLSSNINNCQS